MPEIESSSVDASPSGYLVFDAEEHEAIPVPLSLLLSGTHLDLYEEVTGKDYFKVYSRGDQLVFQAGGFVGQIAVNPRVAINIRPRADVGRNLERILLTSEHPPQALVGQQRHYGVYDIPNPSLLDLLAQALLGAMQEIAAQGLHREYHLTQKDTSFPRGRILIGETMQRQLARGMHHEVTAAWYQQTPDTATNRCMKYALWYLAHRYQTARPLRAGVQKLLFDLNNVYHAFDGVELDHQRRFLLDPLVADPTRLPAIRVYYRNAINLATTIIRDRGITFNGERDDIVMPSLLIDMEKAFEDYLRTVLRTRMASRTSRFEVLDGTKGEPQGARKLLFDQPPSEPAKPDIVIRDTTPAGDDPSIPIVIDAKYKKVRGLPDRADINQAIAYAVSYRAPTVILAHPWVPDALRGTRRFGQIGELQLQQYAFNLGAEDLDAEEEAFATSILQLLQ